MKHRFCLFAVFVLFFGCMVVMQHDRFVSATAGPVGVFERASKTVILDAGHGGEDGGAVSATGITESMINLSVVQSMDSILGFWGTAPILLRNEDISLHDSDAVTLREKKVSDLNNRVAIIQNIPQGTLISIHQNSYPDGRYRGGQTFYAPTDGSKALAQHIQAVLKKSLQPDNNRESKAIPDTVYLMNHVNCPAVLVECGFLTNTEEASLLADPGYQKKLAVVLSGAWLSAEKINLS